MSLITSCFFKSIGTKMVVQNELEKIYQDLLEKENGQVFICGSDITVRVFDGAAKLSLLSPIYFGGNYIPKNVRKGITKTPPFEKNQSIKTSITVDEDNFRIFLNYLDTTSNLNNQKFSHLVEEFGVLADEWRIYLDEHDKDDLVYVHAK